MTGFFRRPRFCRNDNTIDPSAALSTLPEAERLDNVDFVPLSHCLQDIGQALPQIRCTNASFYGRTLLGPLKWLPHSRIERFTTIVNLIRFSVKSQHQPAPTLTPWAQHANIGGASVG